MGTTTGGLNAPERAGDTRQSEGPIPPWVPSPRAWPPNSVPFPAGSDASAPSCSRAVWLAVSMAVSHAGQHCFSNAPGWFLVQSRRSGFHAGSPPEALIYLTVPTYFLPSFISHLKSKIPPPTQPTPKQSENMKNKNESARSESQTLRHSSRLPSWRSVSAGLAGARKGRGESCWEAEGQGPGALE